MLQIVNAGDHILALKIKKTALEILKIYVRRNYLFVESVHKSIHCRLNQFHKHCQKPLHPNLR